MVNLIQINLEKNTMQFIISEEEVKEILRKEDDFKKLFRFKTNLNDRVRFLSNALTKVNNKNIAMKNYFIETEINIDLDKFIKCIEESVTEIVEKQVLWITLKKKFPEIEEIYLKKLSDKKDINIKTALFVLLSKDKEIINIDDKQLMIKLLKSITQEKTKSVCYIQELDDFFKDQKNIINFKDELKEIIELYQLNQPYLNKKDYNFYKKQQKNIEFLYSNAEMPKFLYDLYNNTNVIKSEVCYKTKKEIKEIFPGYLKKDYGFNMSLGETIKGNAKKQLLLDENKQITLIISFDAKRYSAIHNSDSLLLNRMCFSFARELKNRAEIKDFKINDFTYTEDKANPKYMVSFENMESALKMKELIDAFLIKIAKQSLNKRQDINKITLEFKDVNKYFNYFVLNEEVKNKEIEFTTKKVKKI